MSIKGAVLTRCPAGCEKFSADVWSLIRADTHPELKEALVAGELNLLLCPDCGRPFYAETTVVYIDPAAEIFAFIFPPSFLAEKEKWVTRMQEDYQVLRHGLAEQLKIDYEPMIFFGFEELQKLIESDLEITDETDVIKFEAEELGLSMTRVKAAAARGKGYPFAVPFSGKKADRNSIIAGSRKMLNENPALSRLAKFLKDFESDPNFVLP